MALRDFRDNVFSVHPSDSPHRPGGRKGGKKGGGGFVTEVPRHQFEGFLKQEKCIVASTALPDGVSSSLTKGLPGM